MKNALIAGIILFAICGCNEAPVNFEGGSVAKQYEMMAPNKAKSSVLTNTKDRKLIKTGRIEFSTPNVLDKRIEIEKATKDFSGYISNDSQQKYDGKIEYEQVIRLPAARFDAFVKVIEGLGDQIEFRDLGTKDVTEEYIDVEARLKTKKELETRYLELLKQAKNVEEMLAVETQISDVRTEIESMQGRINFLTDQVGFSTLTIKYYQVISHETAFASRLMVSFADGWHGLLVFLIGLISIWPFILILGGSVWLISRWSRRINFRIAKKTHSSEG